MGGLGLAHGRGTCCRHHRGLDSGWGLFISNEEAVKLSVSRFAGESVEETSGCPPCRIA
jgi:hypothetical protein